MRWTHRCSVSVAGAVFVASIAVVVAGSALAASVTVENCADSGAGSLRQAVVDAAAGDTIEFASSLVCPVITLTSGEILIDKDLAIAGPGATGLAVSGNGSSRVFNVGGSRVVAISGLTIRAGNTAFRGGGISAGSNSSLTLSATTVTNNTASSGGGIALGLGSSLTLSSSTISDNTATATGFLQGGGGIHLDRVRATVSASTVSGNTAVGDGGGIHNESSSLTISTSDLSGNTARLGGGVYVSGTATTVSSSTVADNTAVVGGGVYNTGGFVTVSTSTITGNTATGNTTFIGRGGGIYNGGTSSSVLASTISGNTAAVGGGGGIYDALDALSIGQGHRVSGTIITDGCNAASSRPPVIDGGYNVDTGSTCVNPAAPATGSRFNTPAGLDLAGLAANGGPTRTIALVAASAAIGLIPNGTVGSCPRTDQRGTASVAGAPCDAGAFQTVSVVCAAGSYSATGSSPCTLAAPGFFVASAGATLATPCPLGAFQDQAGQSSCIPAPIGFYVSQVAAVAATACPPGTTTSVDGATSMGSCVAVVPAPDSVPPLVTGLVTPAANADGWNNTTVIVDRTAVDPAPSGPGIGPTRHHGVDRGCEPDHHF